MLTNRYRKLLNVATRLDRMSAACFDLHLILTRIKIRSVERGIYPIAMIAEPWWSTLSFINAHVPNCLIFLLPVWNLTSSSCSSTPISHAARDFRRFANIIRRFKLAYLHFVQWVVDDARLCVCLSVCLSAVACPHYCTDPDVIWATVAGAPSCALLGGFPVGVRVSLLRRHTRRPYTSLQPAMHTSAKARDTYVWNTANAYSGERKMTARACTRCKPGYVCMDFQDLLAQNGGFGAK